MKIVYDSGNSAFDNGIDEHKRILEKIILDLDKWRGGYIYDVNGNKIGYWDQGYNGDTI